MQRCSVEIIDQWSFDAVALQYENNAIELVIGEYRFRVEQKLNHVFWWRLKGDFSRSVEFKDLQQKVYWTRHWVHLQESIHRLSSVKSVNAPDARMRARLKPVQLAKAWSIGFSIPRTSVGNVIPPKSLGESIFFKPLTSDIPAEGASAFPDRFDRSELEALNENTKLCPSIYQEYCEKQYELRVCVFGDNVYSFALDSQNIEAAKVDWRRVILPDGAISEVSLSDDEEEKCRSIVKALGLDYGILDLVRDLSGNLIFLEVNPDGQWLWLQSQTGVDLAGPFARFLTSFLDA